MYKDLKYKRNITDLLNVLDNKKADYVLIDLVELSLNKRNKPNSE